MHTIDDRGVDIFFEVGGGGGGGGASCLELLLMPLGACPPRNFGFFVL